MYCRQCGTKTKSSDKYCFKCGKILMKINPNDSSNQRLPPIADELNNNPTILNCPTCGLMNPSSAKRCDCGYDFFTSKQEKSYLSDVPHANVHRKQEPSKSLGINNGDKKQSITFTSYRKRIIRAANFGIGLGCFKIVTPIYLFFLIQSESDDSVQQFPQILNTQLLLTMIIGIIYIFFGVRIKKYLTDPLNSIIILLGISIFSLTMSLFSLSNFKIGIDFFILGLFVLALRSQNEIMKN
jgi:hypothetical protein